MTVFFFLTTFVTGFELLVERHDRRDPLLDLSVVQEDLYEQYQMDEQ